MTNQEKISPVKRFFAWLKEVFKRLPHGLNAVKVLTVMQLREKLDLKWIRSFKKTLFKGIWVIVEFVLITVVCYFIFYFIKAMAIFSLVGDIPVSVIAVIFTVMLALSIISSTAGLVKSLYFARDNMVLLTLPARPAVVFLSKLLVYYVYELKKNFMFTVPMFIAYGFVKGYSVGYYPWLLFLFIFISALPVIISALLSIPFMFVYQFVRKVKGLQYVLYAILAAGVMYLVFTLIGMIPENIDLLATWSTTYWEIQDFLKAFSEANVIIVKFTELIVGKTIGITPVVFHQQTFAHFMILLGVCIVLFVLSILLAMPLFFKMASKPFEYSKKSKIKKKKNKPRNGFISAIKKEFVIGIRGNTLVTKFAISVIVLPILIELLNTLYEAMSTRLLGMQMTVSFNVVIILLVLLASNIDIASCYSRDGSTAYLNKVQPKDYLVLLSSKLFWPMVISLMGAVASTTVFASHSSLTPLENVLFGVTVFMVAACHIFWSAESDIMRPQYEQYATFSEQANNPNENMSAILTIALSVVFCGLSLFLAIEGTSGVWIKLAIISTAIMAVKAVTFILKVKVFYKEKQ